MRSQGMGGLEVEELEWKGSTIGCFAWEIKEVGLLNANGYFKSLLSFIDKGVEEGLPNFGLEVGGIKNPSSAHNRYPEIWAQMNRKFTEECKSSLAGNDNEDPSDHITKPTITITRTLQITQQNFSNKNEYYTRLIISTDSF
ncbi:hypothetical protein Tco_1452187 [Tanacetum coccineum]